MALSRKLFVNWHTRKRQRSDVSGGPDVVSRLGFAKYENAPLEIVLIEPDPNTPGPNNFIRVDITDLSLKVVINDSLDDATPLVQQTTWTKNTGDSTFTGYLDLNTGTMNTYMGSADKTPYFEIEITDSGGGRVKVLTEPCDVIVGVAQVTTTSPDPSQVYYTAAEIEGMFMRRILGPGETLTLQNNVGGQRILGLRDDGTPQDDY